jgi:hypothetical protein
MFQEKPKMGCRPGIDLKEMFVMLTCKKAK